jgi:glycosyltransferase involved in cell wall biosynthesis
MKKVQWFGAHPEECSLSMDIYRNELIMCETEGDRYEVQCWPDEPVVANRKKRRLRRAFAKYYSYPLRVRMVKDVSLVHFLDHSSAHLLSVVPEKVAKVVTLHDLIPMRYAGELSARQHARFKSVVETMLMADAVISVSEYSKKEAVDLLGLDENKIHVVPNGVRSMDFLPAMSAHVRLLKDRGADVVILSISSCLRRKNLSILPEVLKIAQEKSGQKLGLLRVGGALPSQLLEELEQTMGPEFILEAGKIDWAELQECYASADVLFFPSLYEGFGLPVLEAMVYGTPVAASSSSSIPEVGGKLAEYFDPNDAEDAALAVLSCLLHVETAREHRIEHARTFSWERHRRGCFDVYDKVLSEFV